MYPSFEFAKASALDKPLDLTDNRFHVSQDLGIGEAQDRVASQLQLYVPAVIRFELFLAAVLRSVDLDHAAVLTPHQVHHDRVG
jgi:hypothetical protein